MKIFVYEHEENLCNLFKYYLEDHGHEVKTSCKEKEALAMASASSFDLYILSHSRFDNIEVFVSLVPRHKILILSTADQETINRDLTDFKVLNKPFEFIQFESAILAFSV